MRVLVIDDDPRLRQNTTRQLREAGYAVDAADSASEGLAKAALNEYDAIVLDGGLPRLEDEPLRHRQSDRPTPVLTIDAQSSAVDRPSGKYETGERLARPFDAAELISRLRALIQRAAGLTEPTIAVADITIDLRVGRVLRQGAPVPVTAREYAILELLALHRGKPLSRNTLFEHIFDETDETVSNVVDVHVFSLRKKLGAQLIATHRGIGYGIPG